MMIINKKKALIGLSVLLIIVTLTLKILLTRAIKSRFSALAIEEADGLHAIVHGRQPEGETIDIAPLEPEEASPLSPDDSFSSDSHTSTAGLTDSPGPSASRSTPRFLTWKLPQGAAFPSRWGFGDDGRQAPPRQPQMRRKSIAFDAEVSSQRSASRLVSASTRLIAPILARIDRRFSQQQDDVKPPAEVEDEVLAHGPSHPAFGLVEAARRDSQFFLPALSAHQRGNAATAAAAVASSSLVTSHKSPSLWIDHPNDSRRFSYQP